MNIFLKSTKNSPSLPQQRHRAHNHHHFRRNWKTPLIELPRKFEHKMYAQLRVKLRGSVYVRVISRKI